MNAPDPPAASREARERWMDAVHAAALFAVDPVGIGGVSVRAGAGPVRDRWLAMLRAGLAATAPLRKMPINIGDASLLGGLDLAATLRAGRPVAERGLLAQADGGAVLVAMAERLPEPTAARLAAVLDAGFVTIARDTVLQNSRAKIGLVALDEGISDDEGTPRCLLDRLALHIDLRGIGLGDAAAPDHAADDLDSARGRLAAARVDATTLDALSDTATALGIGSLRAPLLAARVARAAAALAGRTAVTLEDAALASRLVLAPRATMLPMQQAPADPNDAAGDMATIPESAPEPEQTPEAGSAGEPQEGSAQPQPIGEVLLQAAQAAIPANLLQQFPAQRDSGRRIGTPGRVGALRSAGQRGRPSGTRAGEVRDGARLSVIETLRAAAPWQRLRRGEDARAAPARVQVRREDFRVTRLRQRAGTTTIFVVDASGSAAANRLAESKGAVELLLADCYVRRDQVSVIGFRGSGAQLLLPPTRSLVRAKRSLAGLPGGGGTPLAAGIDAAWKLAETVRRRGETPTIVLLTDGRGNVARDGSGGRSQAAEDARDAARRLRAAAVACILLDTSVRPQAEAARLATEMGARYLPLPYASARTLAQAVRATAGQPDAGVRSIS